MKALGIVRSDLGYHGEVQMWWKLKELSLEDGLFYFVGDKDASLLSLVIGVDGCHLKNKYGGIFLAAIATDPNDHQKWVLISDQQKGLVPTFEEMLGDNEHCFCLRHLYNTFNKRFGGGIVMGDLMMGATRATYHEAYLEKMAQLKEINEAAHKYLVDIGEQHWSKHAFKTYAKCDVLMNNLSESFNAIILLAREKPIVTMLEWIQTYCMTRFATMNETTHKVEGKIMPIAKAKEEARQGRSTQWELLVGIPCRHAIAAINYKGEHAEDHVDKYYHRDTYKLCYSHSITTIDGRKKCSKTNDPDLLPPNYKRAAGRPKKLRRREVDED